MAFGMSRFRALGRTTEMTNPQYIEGLHGDHAV